MTSFRGFVGITLVMVILAAVSSLRAQQPDNSSTPQDEAAGFTVEKLDNTIRFAADGTAERSRTMRIKLESDAAVRTLGVLAFSYNSENEQLAVDFVRVRKADGRLVETPQSNIQDTPSPVTSAAPMYSDLRVKQIPVRALANADWLEYQIRWIETKPMIANQFWYQHDFLKDTEVKEETLTIQVPSDKYIKLSHPGGQPEVRDENGDRIYFWKTSHATKKEAPERPTLRRDDTKQVKKAEAKTQEAEENKKNQHSVELTTFRSWEEVGRWYAQLASQKVAVTPAIQAKADDLTKGLTSADARARALYEYVSTKFRYISVSFGEGRYQPHGADEVLANLYGDCKDKHTLLSSLLKAAGIESAAVLIGAGLPFNPDIPSPAQFNHVITLITANGKDVWLDATPEVAPFGLIDKELRDHQALTVPASGAPRVVTTPAAAAVAYSEVVQFKGALNSDGMLKGHLDITLRGDAELVLRAAFHETPPAQWTDLAQRFSQSMGYAGTVSGVDVDNPQDTTNAFHYGWDYKREKFSDWENLRIMPALPGMGLPPMSDDPAEGVDLAFIGDARHDSIMELPPGFSVDIPGPVHLTTAFAEFQSSYTVKGSLLETHRVMTIRKDKVPASGRGEYEKFASAVNSNLGQFTQLARVGLGAPVMVSESNPRAEELVESAVESLRRGDVNSARDALKQAELLNAKQRNLWAVYSALYGISNEKDKARESMRKEIEQHPGQPQLYRALAEMEFQYGNTAEGEQVLRELLKIVPGDLDATRRLVGILISHKQFDEAIATLDQALKVSPGNLQLETLKVEALLKAGRKQDGVVAAREIGVQSPDANDLNSVAWQLTESGADLKLAREYADRAIRMLENDLKDVQLSALKQEQLREEYLLAMVWDTAGWANFLSGDIATAERQIEAAWKLSQHGAVADHLAQIYEKQGKKDQAVHMLQLALATGDRPEGASERLQKLDPQKVNAGRAAPEELGKLRTVALTAFTRTSGTAEFFVLLSAKGVEDVMFISGDDALRGAKEAIAKGQFDASFADNGPERIARRGILSCSPLTKPNCQLVLLLPSNTTAL